MTDHERDRDVEEARRRRVKVTDKRRTHAPDGEERRGASEGTPLVTGEAPSRSGAAGEGERAEEATDASTELEKARAQAAEYLEHLQRLKAEFDNYRKRILREQTRAVETASEGVISRLLEVLDEFELALVAAERQSANDRFAHGVEMVYAKLIDILKGEGLERMEAKGRPFDPERHEALLRADGDEEGEPYVEDVLRTGYTLKGRVIRPAGVKVGHR